MQRFDVKPESIKSLDRFENYIYEFSRDDGEFILRTGHSLRRTPEMIAGEVDWINYLAEGGANVSRAILSKNDQLVEAIDDGHGGQFLATAFVKAPGNMLPHKDWTSEFVQHYGQVIGRLHALTKAYVPADSAWRRPAWDAPGNLDLEDWLSPSDAGVLAKFQELMPHFEMLSKDGDGYGLIHQDAHGANFYVHEGQITLFDFDDCVYGWFIYDIAMVLFYAAMWQEDKAAFAQEFMSDFLRGYSRENQLDSKWLKEIPHFLKLREIDLYAVIHRSKDVENLDDPWCEGYLKGRKERIEADVPYIEFEWGSLIDFL